MHSMTERRRSLFFIMMIETQPKYTINVRHRIDKCLVTDHFFMDIEELNLELHFGYFSSGELKVFGSTRNAHLISTIIVCKLCLDKIISDLNLGRRNWYFPFVNCESIANSVIYNWPVSVQTLFVSSISLTAIGTIFNNNLIFLLLFLIIFYMLYQRWLYSTKCNRVCDHLKINFYNDHMTLVTNVIYAISVFILTLVIYILIRPGAVFGEGKFYREWYNNVNEFITFNISQGYKGYKIYQSQNDNNPDNCILWIGGGGFLYSHVTPSFFESIKNKYYPQHKIITMTYPTIRKNSFKTVIEFFKQLIEKQIKGKYKNTYIVGASAGAYIVRYLLSIDKLFDDINVKHLFFYYGYYGPDYFVSDNKNIDKVLEFCGKIYLNYKTFKPITTPKTVYCGKIDIFYEHNKYFAKIENSELISYDDLGHGWSQCLNLEATTKSLEHMRDTIVSYEN